MSQQERRRTPYPWTWEPAALLLGVPALVVLLGVQAGRALANGLTTGHWQLAPPETWPTTTLAVITGDAGAGLDPHPARAAASTVLWLIIALVQLVTLVPTVLALRWAWRRWSPYRPQGFATPAQVDTVLGIRRLRSTANFIRPDLHHRGQWSAGRRRRR
ncbi:hypothetical protein [Microlunatus flavus]|uniref:Conjugal transfer protein n=1 Tax=Microlunatus flavus TaxID=1036181 RepID=A0A1H9MVQ3_9ACTN|nr:hypothetical protein [Microlunatus flavus]SER27762.1 hypothetical protein SAMN05421756_111100 [Microlunatus flavus]